MKENFGKINTRIESSVGESFLEELLSDRSNARNYREKRVERLNSIKYPKGIKMFIGV